MVAERLKTRWQGAATRGETLDIVEELKRFTAEKAHVRKELRETQRGLDVEINRLDVWLKVLNIAVAPLAVALAGALILSLRRRRRASGGKPA